MSHPTPTDPTAPIPRGDHRRRWLSPWLVDALILVFLLGLTAKMSYDIWAVRDLGVDDESYYLGHAFNLSRWGQPLACYSPLYIGWYYLLSHLPIGRAQLYDGNWALLMFLLSAAVYVVARILAAPRALALLAAAVVLLCPVGNVWPYPVHLATVVLLLGGALAACFRSSITSGLTIGLTLLVTAYVRPEYASAFVLFVPFGAAVGAVAAARGAIRWKPVTSAAAILALSTAVFLAALGNPFGGGKLFFSFGSHYSLNACAERGWAIDPWTNWETVVRGDFGGAKTVPQALRSNPRAFLWHLRRNVRNFPEKFAAVLVPTFGAGEYPDWWARRLFVLFVALGFVGLAARGWRGIPEGGERKLVVVLMTFLFALAPIGASLILIAPRDHYLVPLAVFAIALVGAGLGGYRSAARWAPVLDSWPVVLLIAAGLVAVIPNRAHGWTLQCLLSPHPAPSSPAVLPVRAAARVLEDLHLRDGSGLVILEPDYSRAFYAGLDGVFARPGEKYEWFGAFMTRRDISVVVINGRLLADTGFAKDPEFRAFASGVDRKDFQFFPVPGTDDIVAVRRDKLPPAPR